MPRATSPLQPVRWIIPPPAPDLSIAGLVATLGSQADGAFELPAHDRSDSPWRLVSVKGHRLLLQRQTPDGLQFLKWFGPDRISLRRRAGLRLWESPAARHARWARRLDALGVPVAPTVAAGEIVGRSTLRQGASFVITTSPTTARTLDRAVVEWPLSADQRRALADAVAALASTLHAHGVGRLDLRPDNLLVHSPTGPIPLFDLDRFVTLGFGRAARVRKDLSRVAESRALLLDGAAPAPVINPGAGEAYLARTLYDQPDYAAQYDQSRFHDDARKARRDRRTRAAIVRALRSLPHVESILDLPCGTGRLSAGLLELGYRYTGADLSPSMLGVARAKCAHLADAHFVQADAEALPFPDAAFDAILCVRFFNLVPSAPRRRILTEMRRVSRRFLVIASGYFRQNDHILPILAPVIPRFADRVRENRELHDDLRATGWRPRAWFPYRSRGLLSTTKAIAVFEHGA